MTKFPKSGQTNKWEGMYEFAKAIYDTITFDYSRDKEMRSEFTKKIVEEAWDQCDKDEVSGFIITCTNYQCNDYACKTEIQFSDGIWFDLLCFSGDRESYYHHKGDGGYLNWAIVGDPLVQTLIKMVLMSIFIKHYIIEQDKNSMKMIITLMVGQGIQMKEGVKIIFNICIIIVNLNL